MLYLYTFLLIFFFSNDRSFFLWETFHNITPYSFHRARFSVTSRGFPFPKTPHEVSVLHQFLSFFRQRSVTSPFFFLTLANRRYRDLRPVKRGNEQDVDNDDTLTRSVHRFLLLAMGINFGHARAFFLVTLSLKY